jgi:hypothetical protein
MLRYSTFTNQGKAVAFANERIPRREITDKNTHQVTKEQLAGK